LLIISYALLFLVAVSTLLCVCARACVSVSAFGVFALLRKKHI